MEPSFDRQSRRQQRLDRLNERLGGVPSRFNALRFRLKRSRNGLVLGVFRGIAESLGWSVCWTRILGCIGLLAISGGHHGDDLLVAGFFYLLSAVLMRKPDDSPSRLDSFATHRSEVDADAGRHVPPSSAGSTSARPAAVPYWSAQRAPRVDFAALDRQLDGLNRRIQRMEGIVTDRQYDWDRRMES